MHKIHKKYDPSDISNYRPVSLLSTVGKVLEKIVHKHLFNFLNAHHVITTLQSGFIPGDSTVNQLVHIYNTFCKALDEGKEIRVIFCDISKAFDRVWHKGYFTNSKQQVYLGLFYLGLLSISMIDSKDLYCQVVLLHGNQ